MPTYRIPRTALIGALALAVMQTQSACEPKKATIPLPCGATLCDVREESCQESVRAVLECFRGGAPELPQIDVLSEDEYRELLREQPTLSEAQRLKRARFAYGMSLLKLAPEEESLDGGTGEEPDTDAGVEADAGTTDSASFVVARYFTEDQRLVVIDHGRPSDTANALSFFAHELVHAFQDQEHDLDDFFAESSGTLDEAIARTAIVEGEATQYDVLTFAALNGVPPGAIAWGPFYESWQDDEVQGAYQDEAPLRTALTRYPFPFGGYLVTYNWLGFGQRAVDGLFDSPPRSTLEVLWLGPLPEREAEQAEALQDELVPVPPQGFDLVAYDQLGVLLVDVFLHRFELTDAVNVENDVQDVLGDGVSVFYDAHNERTVTVWRLRWLIDEGPSSRELAAWRDALGASAEAPQDDPDAGMDGGLDGGLDDSGVPDAGDPEPAEDVLARVFVDGDDLFVIISDQPLAPAWLGDLEWQAPPEGSAVNAE